MKTVRNYTLAFRAVNFALVMQSSLIASTCPNVRPFAARATPVAAAPTTVETSLPLTNKKRLQGAAAEIELTLRGI